MRLGCLCFMEFDMISTRGTRSNSGWRWKAKGIWFESESGQMPLPLTFGNCNSYGNLETSKAMGEYVYIYIYIWIQSSILRINQKKRIEKDPTWKENRLPGLRWEVHQLVITGRTDWNTDRPMGFRKKSSMLTKTQIEVLMVHKYICRLYVHVTRVFGGTLP